MAAFCINIHLQEFKDTAKRLGISEFEFEQIAYKYGNQEGTFGQFPSDEYIKEQLSGVPNYNATEAQAKLWSLRYSKPREFDTLEELNAAKKDALQYFSDDSVRSFVNAYGKYELRIAEQDNEYQRIKEQALADGNFMKAPNGNQSNLNEQQWIQVRTKAFKRWFGDWEKQYMVYQGMQSSSADSRKFNYYTISAREASRYGHNVRGEAVSTEGFLQVIKDGKYSEEFTNLVAQFEQATGRRFDILDNSAKGLQTQSEFFNFLESKGYKGIDFLTENPGLYKKDIENPYIVTFGNQQQANVSKVVDENGEPLVVYHGTYSKEPITEFSIDKIRNGGGFWFTTERGEYGNTDYATFLNLRNPYSAYS